MMHAQGGRVRGMSRPATAFPVFAMAIMLLLAAACGEADRSRDAMPFEPVSVADATLTLADESTDADTDGVVGRSVYLPPPDEANNGIIAPSTAPLLPRVFVDFEQPALGGDTYRILDPFRVNAYGITFRAVPDTTFYGTHIGQGVVGLVRNSHTSACADPPSADQKLASGVQTESYESLGRSGFRIEARFDHPLPPGSVVSFEMQALALGTGRIWFYDEQSRLLGAAAGYLNNPSGTCGYPGSPRGRRVVGGIAPGRVKFIWIDATYWSFSNLVFVIDDFSVERSYGFALDIRPGSCPNPLNPRSAGVLPVAVASSVGSVDSAVDPHTLRLEGVAPLRWSSEDVTGMPYGDSPDCGGAEPDGLDDLVLKFSTQDIVRALGARIEEGNVELSLTGRLFDGTELVLTDRMVVTGRRSARPGAESSWNPSN